MAVAGACETALSVPPYVRQPSATWGSSFTSAGLWVSRLDRSPESFGGPGSLGGLTLRSVGYETPASNSPAGEGRFVHRSSVCTAALLSPAKGMSRYCFLRLEGRYAGQQGTAMSLSTAKGISRCYLPRLEGHHAGRQASCGERIGMAGACETALSGPAYLREPGATCGSSLMLAGL